MSNNDAKNIAQLARITGLSQAKIRTYVKDIEPVFESGQFRFYSLNAVRTVVAAKNADLLRFLGIEFAPKGNGSAYVPEVQEF